MFGNVFLLIYLVYISISCDIVAKKVIIDTQKNINMKNIYKSYVTFVAELLTKNRL